MADLFGTGPLTSPIYSKFLADLDAKLQEQKVNADHSDFLLQDEAARRRGLLGQQYDALAQQIQNAPALPSLPVENAPSTGAHVLASLLGGETQKSIGDTEDRRREEIAANTKTAQNQAADKVSALRNLQMDRLTKLSHYFESIGNLADAAKYTKEATKLAEMEHERTTFAQNAAMQESEGLRQQSQNQAMIEAALGRAFASHLGVGVYAPMKLKDYNTQLEKSFNDFADPKTHEIKDSALPGLRIAVANLRHEGMQTPQQWLASLSNMTIRKGGFFSGGKGVKLFDMKDPATQQQLNALADVLFPAGQAPTAAPDEGTTDTGADTGNEDNPVDENVLNRPADEPTIRQTPLSSTEAASYAKYQTYAGQATSKLTALQRKFTQLKESESQITGPLADARKNQVEHERALLRIQINSANRELEALHQTMVERFGSGIGISIPETVVH